MNNQYKTATNLNQRRSLHEKYSTNKLGFGNWQFQNYIINPGSRILELGSGTGAIWLNHLYRLQGCKLVLSDLSQGMIDSAKELLGHHPNISYEIMDIQNISYDNQTFDIVIANSMLYHVPDIHKGLSEVRRVLKKDGYFYCSTYGEYGMFEWIYEVLKEFGVKDNTNKRFTLQTGTAILQKHFSHVVRKDYEDSLIVTDVDDLVTYILSCEGLIHVRNIPSGKLKAAFERRMVNGVINIPKEYGMFLCRD